MWNPCPRPVGSYRYGFLCKRRQALRLKYCQLGASGAQVQAGRPAIHLDKQVLFWKGVGLHRTRGICKGYPYLGAHACRAGAPLTRPIAIRRSLRSGYSVFRVYHVRSPFVCERLSIWVYCRCDTSPVKTH